MINYNSIDKIREYINTNKEKIDGTYITNKSNLKYILGSDVADRIYVTLEKIYIMIGSIYIEEAKKIVSEDCVLINISDKSAKDVLKQILENRVIGIEAQDLTVAHERKLVNEYNVKNVIDIENIVEKIRIIKYNNEISNIKKACEITSKAFEHIIQYINVGQTEIQIRNELNRYMFELGANELAFDTIVASGENSSKPHAVVSDRCIQPNDIILFDFGAKFDGYCSDMSRTIFVGEPNEEMKKMYNLVLNTQTQGINSIKPDIIVGSIHEFVVNEFSNENVQDKFIHTTGHGVGIDIHEIPVIIDTNKDDVFKQGMIVTVEPGIYFEKKYGIRIEDTVLVTDNGAQVLTNCNKDMIII